MVGVKIIVIALSKGYMRRRGFVLPCAPLLPGPHCSPLKSLLLKVYLMYKLVAILIKFGTTFEIVTRIHMNDVIFSEALKIRKHPK